MVQKIPNDIINSKAKFSVLLLLEVIGYQDRHLYNHHRLVHLAAIVGMVVHFRVGLSDIRLERSVLGEINRLLIARVS